MGVKEVSLSLISYIDDEGLSQTQLAIIGDNNVHLLSGRAMGISDTTNQGQATKWLRDAIFEKLGKPVPQPPTRVLDNEDK